MTFYNFNNLLQHGFLCFQIQNYFYYNIYFAYFLKLIKFVKKQDTENDSGMRGSICAGVWQQRRAESSRAGFLAHE
jgi:hypothetical protein